MSNFATAKVVKKSGMRTKNLYFLILFILTMGVANAQNTDKHNQKMDKATYVKIETSMGDMVVKLYDETPQHRDNFIKLVKNGTYDGLLFHRVIQGFMVQGGDPDSKDARPGQPLGGGTLGYTIPAEFVPDLIHKKGALSAARQGDEVNPRKESSASQFYIVQGEIWDANKLRMVQQRYGKQFSAEAAEVYATVGGTPFLDGDYTVFGEVVEGLEVIDKIAAVECDRMNRPVKDITMKMTIIEKK